LDHHGRDSYRLSGGGVLPIFADHKRVVDIKAVFKRGLAELSGTWFATGAVIAFVMRAKEKLIDRKSSLQESMHQLKLSPGEIAAGDFGKIGGGEDHESRFLNLLEMRDDQFVDLKFLNTSWSSGFSVLDHGLYQKPNPFKKYR